MTERPRSANLLNLVLGFFAALWRGRRYQPERHYLRGKPSGRATSRRFQG